MPSSLPGLGSCGSLERRNSTGSLWILIGPVQIRRAPLHRPYGKRVLTVVQADAQGKLEREMASPTTTDVPALRTLLGSWDKGLRTLSMYLPNNPVRQQMIAALQEGLSEVWQQLPKLALTVSEAGLEWESEIVLPNEDRAESLGWTLFSDGIRFIVFSPGVEGEEIVTFLELVQRARTLTDEDEDDLRTLLWSADFQFIRYQVAHLEQGDGEPMSEPMGDVEAVDLGPRPTAAEVLGSVEEEVAEEGGESLADEGGDGQGGAPGPKAPVNMAEFESTFYFLDGQEIEYLKGEVRREYGQNLNENVLSMLFDIFEAQHDAGARAEIITVLGDLLPSLLNSGDFHSVAYLISEAGVVLGRAEELLPAHQQLLEGLTRTLSKPEAVGQLLQALEVAQVEPSTEELEELFGQLRPGALGTILKWLRRLSNEDARKTLTSAVARMAEGRPAAVGVALKSSERVVVAEALRLIAELGLRGVGEQLVGLVEHDDVGIRAALVPALAAAPTSQTMGALVSLIEDADPDVRIAAVEALAMRRFQGAVLTLEEVVLGKEIRSRDLAERRAFFESYGIIAGEAGVSQLRKILLSKGFGRRIDSDTRACAAMGLGHVPTESARGALQQATKDRDPVVRSAATRALQQDIK